MKPKGTKDYFGIEAMKKEWVIDTIRSVYKQMGFDPLYTSALEKYSILNKKGGEEIMGQIFKIENSDIGLRFDLTVPLVRFYTERRDMKLPFKRYQIQQVWRREEPQRKRLREFTQADIDIIGGKEPWADLWVLETLLEALDRLDIKVGKVILNSREAVNQFSPQLLRLLDKLDKKERSEVEKEVYDKGLEEEWKQFWESDLAYPASFYKIVDALKEEGHPVLIDKTMVRGLDYYSGTIFEIKAHGEPLTVAAGGRYDRLLKMFGVETGAVGGSIGVDRILDLVEWAPPKKRLVAWKDVWRYAASIAKKLDAFLFPEPNIKKALSYAQEYDEVIIVGPEEARKRTYIIKDMKTGEQREFK